MTTNEIKRYKEALAQKMAELSETLGNRKTIECIDCHRRRGPCGRCRRGRTTDPEFLDYVFAAAN